MAVELLCVLMSRVLMLTPHQTTSYKLTSAASKSILHTSIKSIIVRVIFFRRGGN